MNFGSFYDTLLVIHIISVALWSLGALVGLGFVVFAVLTGAHLD